MKRITLTIPVNKTVVIEDGTQDIEAWEASDGKIFSGWGCKKSCEEYEEDLKHAEAFSSIKFERAQYHGINMCLPDEWYYIENDEQKKALKHYWKLKNCFVYYEGSLEKDFNLNEWVGVVFHEMNDRENEASIYQWSDVREILNNYSKIFEE